MRLFLISCEIFYREMCWAMARSPHRFDVCFLPKGLHDLPTEQMRNRVQEAVSAVDDPELDAIVLGFGLCNNGLVGVAADHYPLVLPRAHDCLTLFFGSKEKYKEYFYAHPGTYFYTSGWIERGSVKDDLKEWTIQRELGLHMSHDEMIKTYGEENADYIREVLGSSPTHYEKITFIETGIEPDDSFEKEARIRADREGWRFEKEPGSLSLIERLMNGDWNDEDFLTVQPGHRIAPSHDDAIVKSVPVESPPPGTFDLSPHDR